MRIINFYFTSILFSILILFFLSLLPLAHTEFNFIGEFSDLVQILLVVFIVLLVFSLTDGFLLLYFKVRERLWGWKEVDWTLIAIKLDDFKKFSVQAVAKRLKEDLNIQSLVILQGLLLSRLYVLSSGERAKIDKKFFQVNKNEN